MSIDKSEELRILAAEFDWLLAEEVPSILKQLKNFLQSCLQKFIVHTSPAHTVKGNNFLLSIPNSDAVKGVINVAGDSVIKAELKFKFSKGSTAAIGTFIFEQFPWKLQQLQDTSNHLKIAFEELKECENVNCLTEKRQVTQLLDKVMISLSCAKTSLLVPEKKSLSDILSINAQKVLNPALPEELLVSFHINCDRLVFRVFVLNTLTTAPNQKHHHHDQTSVGSFFEHESRWFEVTNKVEIICVVPWLKDMIVWINTAQQLCQQLQDKLKMFDTLPNLKEIHVKT